MFVKKSKETKKQNEKKKPWPKRHETKNPDTETWNSDIKNYKPPSYTRRGNREGASQPQPISNCRDTASTEMTASGADLHTEVAGWSTKPMDPQGWQSF